jgi:hypothetical protein
MPLQSTVTVTRFPSLVAPQASIPLITVRAVVQFTVKQPGAGEVDGQGVWSASRIR